MSDLDIIITGAPGSGKGKFAHRLATSFWTTEPDTDYAVVQGYPEEVAQFTGLALEDSAGYVGNLLVLAERLKHEVRWIKEEQPYIMVGSVWETITHYAIHVGRYIRRSDQSSQAQATIFMQLCGVVLAGFGTYPVTLIKKLPLDSDPNALFFENQLIQTLDMYGGFNPGTLVVEPGTEEEELESSLAHIAHVREVIATATADESSVRESAEAREGGTSTA